MDSLVLDASALVRAVVGGGDVEELLERLQGSEVHAPHLIDAEYGQVLRRLERSGALAAELATAAAPAGAGLIDQRHAHVGPLADRAWQLRAFVSYYDALYVALAEALDAPLLTADGKLAAAHLPAHIRVLPTESFNRHHE